MALTGAELGMVGGAAGAFKALDIGMGAYGSKLAWDRQKRMAQNQIQWRVQDMIKAGINPLLAVTQGGGGAGATPAPQFGNANTAQSALMLAQLKKVNAEIDLLGATTDKTRNEVRRYSPWAYVGEQITSAFEGFGRSKRKLETTFRGSRYSPEMSDQLRAQLRGQKARGGKPMGKPIHIYPRKN